MVIPYFSPEGHKTAARQDQSLLDKVLAQIGKKIPSPKERLEDVLHLFEESAPLPEVIDDLRQSYAPA
jgi:hypothetical protein